MRGKQRRRLGVCGDRIRPQLKPAEVLSGKSWSLGGEDKSGLGRTGKGGPAQAES